MPTAIFLPIYVPEQTSFVWTDFTPSVDTRTIYVSDSTGNDANSGLTSALPKRTLLAAYALQRDNFPDWTLLKRGDTWTGQIAWHKQGRSLTEPALYSSYGTGARPRIVNEGYRANGTGNIAIVGIDLECIDEAPIAYGAGISIFSNVPAANYLIEDCIMKGHGSNCAIQGQSGPTFQNIKIRGCVFVDAHYPYSMAQGLFIDKTNGLLIEGCVFDHNGWSETAPGGGASIYSHNMYLQYDCTNVIVRNNITARASSHGLHQRMGGLCEDNLSLQNPIGLQFGYDGYGAETNVVTGTMRRNVCLDGRDIDPSTTKRGNAIWIVNPSNAQVYENIVAHNETAGKACGFTMSGFDDTSFHDNIVYDWTDAQAASAQFGAVFHSTGLGTLGPPTGVNTFSNNVYVNTKGKLMYFLEGPGTSVFTFDGNRYHSGSAQDTWYMVGATGSPTMDPNEWVTLTGETGLLTGAPDYVDPNRTIATYAASIGLGASLDAFLTAARAQSRDNWRDDLTALAVNMYIRAGFVVV